MARLGMLAMRATRGSCSATTPTSARYKVDERAGTITHHVEGSLFPEDLGNDFVRPFTLDGDTLTLKFTSTADGVDVTRTLMFSDRADARARPRNPTTLRSGLQADA